MRNGATTLAVAMLSKPWKTVGSTQRTFINVKKLLTDAAFLFLVGSLIGWLYEVGLHLVKDGVFVNRGMLHGPWVPIYGLDCMMMVLLKRFLGNRPALFFGVSVLGCGVMEYTSSWLSEKLYHARWWDYSNCPLNLNGRVFLGGLLGFGIAGCIFVFMLLPVLKKQYQKIPEKLKEHAAALFLVVFAADLAVSLLSPNMGFGITSY